MNCIYDKIRRYKRENKTDILYMIPIYRNERLEGYLRPLTFESEQSMPGVIATLSAWRKENPTAANSEFTVTDERTKKWLYKYVLNNEDRIIFIIITLNHEYIGQIGLAHFDENDNSAELDSVIRGQKNIEKGMMTDALNTLIQWGKQELQLKNFYLYVFNDNENAINFYKRNDFLECGRCALVKVIHEDEMRWEEDSRIDVEKAERCYIKMKYCACGGDLSMK